MSPQMSERHVAFVALVGEGGGVQHVLPLYGGDDEHAGVNEDGAFSHVTPGVDAGTLLSV